MRLWNLIYPEKKLLTDEEVIRWASDLIADGNVGEGDELLTEADVSNDPVFAVSIIMDSGQGTFAKGAR